MNKKIAAVLLAATMLSTPAFAASVASPPNTSTAQTVTNDKVTKTSDKGVKPDVCYHDRRHEGGRNCPRENSSEELSLV
jgi:hypothetical protein